MKIYGLSGKSGTGKSYNASELCYRLNIPAIIDDGLFIYGSSIAAGVSAKKQETRIGAVKTALFMDNDHCAQVRAAIRRAKPSAILILGTSDDMVEKIEDRGPLRPAGTVPHHPHRGHHDAGAAQQGVQGTSRGRHPHHSGAYVRGQAAVLRVFYRPEAFSEERGLQAPPDDGKDRGAADVQLSGPL